MKKLTKEAEAILIERFGKDSIIALATTADGTPYVRKVNAFYFDGAFYVLTYGLSNKMKQIAENPVVAITGDWFTAHGKGVNLGYFGKEENKEIANLMRTVFAEISQIHTFSLGSKPITCDCHHGIFCNLFHLV